MEASTKKPYMHLGRKVGRMRELLGIKQETLAAELGISQQAVSKLEQTEKIDDEKLEQVAKVLGVNSEAIRNFNEETALNVINNTFQDFHDHAQAMNNQCTFNPLDKYVEAVEDLKRLSEKNERLYEELLKTEREKIAMLERLLGERSKS